MRTIKSSKKAGNEARFTYRGYARTSLELNYVVPGKFCVVIWCAAA